MEYDTKLRETLESKFAIYVLLLIQDKIKEGKSCIKTDIVKAEKGNERTKFLRIGDLEEVGLIKIDQDSHKHNTAVITMTDKGEEVANLLRVAIKA